MRSWIRIDESRAAMGTDFELSLVVPARDERRAGRSITAAFSAIRGLEAELTEFAVTSPVRAFNVAPVGEAVTLGRRAGALLRLAEDARARTGGAFDAVRGRAGGFRAEWLADGRARITRGAASVGLGFGAIGKGFALDEVALAFARDGWADFRLSAGGSSLVFRGEERPGRPWSWIWSWNRDPADGAAAAPPLPAGPRAGYAVGVSGVAERGEHIVDRREPADAPVAPLRGALVLHRSATWADALSTALFVSGPDACADWSLEHHRPLRAGTVDREGRLRAATLALGALAASGSAVLLLPRPARAEESSSEDGGEQDLNALDSAAPGAAPGVAPFLPYAYANDRSPAWLLLPALAILLCVLHLRKPRPRRTDP